MELTVGVAVAYERLRSSERGRRVGAMVKLCSPPESREKIGNDEMFGSILYGAINVFAVTLSYLSTYPYERIVW